MDTGLLMEIFKNWSLHTNVTSVFLESPGHLGWTPEASAAHAGLSPLTHTSLSQRAVLVRAGVAALRGHLGGRPGEPSSRAQAMRLPWWLQGSLP